MASKSVIDVVTKVCLVTECARPTRSKGMCASHYTQWRKGAPIEGISPRWHGPECSEPGCERLASARHLCAIHYLSHRSAGRLDAHPFMRPQGEPCSTHGCDRPSNARGLCSLHYSREFLNEPERNRANNLWTNFRMSIEEYDEMLLAQGGVCAICGSVPGRKRLAVDHDHSCCSGVRSCGECVRGLLCSSCNTGLGRFRDSADILARAVDYLRGSDRG